MHKIVYMAFSFCRGGAGIAANKFFFLASKIQAFELVKISQDTAGQFQFIKRLISFALGKFQYDGNPIKHSLNIFSYPLALKALIENKEQLHHLHWFNNDTISVFDLHKIPPGSIVTLHDEWLYCGTEHYYKIDDPVLDFINGYTFFKKGIWGVHWNFIIWKIKLAKLSQRQDLIYTVPSSWMLSRASKSMILKSSDIRLLPNPIDVEVFSRYLSLDNQKFREQFDIYFNDIVLVFGAIGGKSNYLKGANLLEDALKILSTELDSILIERIKLIDFGGKSRSVSCLHGFVNVSLGHISDQTTLAKLYSCADCVIVPSLVESFGQVAAEALACETPVVCFNYSGVTDIVIDGESGFLVKPYDVEDLARQIKNLILLDHEARLRLGKRGRKHVVDNFSYSVISTKYNQIINDALLLKFNN